MFPTDHQLVAFCSLRLLFSTGIIHDDRRLVCPLPTHLE